MPSGIAHAQFAKGFQMAENAYYHGIVHSLTQVLGT